MEDKTKEELSKEILKTFHEQFSSNQNHNQKLFIQFFSAVFIVIIGYVLVYTNTLPNADSFYTIKNTTGEHIISYSIAQLIGAYIIAEVIMIFLGALILNSGYSLRRDQKVTYNIRKYALGATPFYKEQSQSALPQTDSSTHRTMYDYIFGRNQYSPFDKGLLEDSFLPTFNAIFFNFIILVQIFLYISMLLALSHIHDNVFNLFHHHSIWSSILFFIPILISFIEYIRYFIKYQTKVVQVHHFKGASFFWIFSIVQETVLLVPVLLGIDYWLQPNPIYWLPRILALLILVGSFVTTLLGFVIIYFQPKKSNRK